MSRANRQSAWKTSDKNQSSLADFLAMRLREGLIIMILAICVFLLVSVLTYHRADPSWSHLVNSSKVANAGGRVGAWLSDLLLYLFGYLAYLFPIQIAYMAWLVFQNKKTKEEDMTIRLTILGLRSFGFIISSIAGSGLINLYLPVSPEYLPYHAGGIVGSEVVSSLLGSFNPVGTKLILMAIFLTGVTLFTGLSWLKLCETIGNAVVEFLGIGCTWFKRLLLRIYIPAVNGIKTRTQRSSAPSFSSDSRTTAQPAEISIASPVDKISADNKIKSKVPSGIRAEMEIRNSLDAYEPLPVHTPKKTAVPVVKETHHTVSGDIIPPLSLLDLAEPTTDVDISPQVFEQRSHEVEQRLADFGVQVKVVAVYPGPVVTRFELQLAAGTKVSKITTLVKDLARSLSVISVRVVEVIPGKSVIGIELPNQHRQLVTLREVLDSKQYNNSRAALTLGLGKDIAGHPVVVDIAKMPHLLVAGTTGSGKSVTLNAMLLSLIYKSTPQQLRLILIDPKMIELSVYDGIPHLLTPVVTDMKDAAAALRWCVVEMERRYRLMAVLGVRNLAGYNAKIKAAAQRGEPLLDPFAKADPNKVTEQDSEPKTLQELPQIVVLADEFADMMVVVGKKVETLIARLAQKARAAGVHLILATQRPSVDVITGLIKANIPTRISFQVSSKIDSRTILDQQGAEQLLGHGDMLYLPPGTGVPVRVHGAFVSDEEVHRVVSYLKEQGQPDYMDEVLDDSVGIDDNHLGNASAEMLLSGGEDVDGEKDPYYDEAVQMVAQSRRVSVSSVQRRFKIGYNRAARIVEAMENAGVVSKMETNGSREVLVPPPNE